MKTNGFMLIIGAATMLSACGIGAASSSSDEPKAEAAESAGNEVEARSEEPEMRRFVNSRDRAINDRLRQRYMDFSFEYPASWRSVPQQAPERESNFAQIRAPQHRGGDTITIAFGTAGFNGLENASQQEFEQLIERLGNDMGREWRNYRLVSHGRQRLGRHDTWGWRFTTDLPGGDGEPLRTHGRADIYLPEGQSHGLYVVTIVTENAEDLPEAEEIGESGDIRRIFQSLSFGSGGDRRGEDNRRSATDDADLEPR